MAVYQVTYWQEIPSQVDARDPGAKAHKVMLSQRFQELIDIAASKRKLDTSDLYIAQWAKGEKTEKAGAAADVAKAVADDFEARFDTIRSEALAKSISAKPA
jgi:hypothetical protein